jgi:WD40 repeat protein
MTAPNYWRKINAFAIDSTEQWCVAGNQLGEILFVDIDTFTIKREFHAVCGSIEAVHVHPTKPYVAAIGADQHVAICRYDGDEIRLIHRIPLRAIEVENHEKLPAGNSQSQALWFHHDDLRLLTKNSSGAATEIAFNDESWEALWCHGYFVDPTGSEELTHIRYLEGSGNVLCSSTGGLVVIDPKNRDVPLLRWAMDVQNIHYAEHVSGSEYILAHDCRSCVLIDASGKNPVRVGPKITRDDIEAITYNPVSKRAFLTSFDRNVYEVDLATCEAKGVVVETPFKLRWIRTLRRAPDTMIAQCRNGALYKFDLKTKQLAGVLRETPNSFWSGVALSPEKTYIAGEGPQVLEITAVGEDRAQRMTTLESKWLTFEGAPGRFTKRMALHLPTGDLLMGRSDGDVIRADPRTGKSRRLINLRSAVRDITAAPEGWDVYAACEDGRAYRLHAQTGDILASFKSEEEPFWSLAYNPERHVLAAAERVGDLILFDPDTMQPRKRIKGLHVTKRMRWFDADRLFLNIASTAYQLRVDTGELSCVIPYQGNTIEDFDWDDGRRYLAAITYHRNLAIFDLSNWEVLDEALTDMDYAHGVMWLSSKRAKGCHPQELITFGRSGVANRFRFHNDRIVNLGPVNRELSTPIVDQGVRVV